MPLFTYFRSDSQIEFYGFLLTQLIDCWVHRRLLAVHETGDEIFWFSACWLIQNRIVCFFKATNFLIEIFD